MFPFDSILGLHALFRPPLGGTAAERPPRAVTRGRPTLHAGDRPIEADGAAAPDLPRPAEPEWQGQWRSLKFL